MYLAPPRAVRTGWKMLVSRACGGGNDDKPLLTGTGLSFEMLSHPPPQEAPEAAQLRGNLFTDLDRLAFALEMEAARLYEAAREDDARQRQALRLGVRLAQRLVTGVWADEVNLRMQTWDAEYDSRLGGMT